MYMKEHKEPIWVRCVKEIVWAVIGGVLLVFIIYLCMLFLEEALKQRYGDFASIICSRIFVAACISIVLGFIFGYISRTVAKSKGYANGFWWGFFLGLLGLLVVALRPDRSKQMRNKSNASSNYTQALVRLAGMREQGILTEEEFKEKKQEILDRI